MLAQTSAIIRHRQTLRNRLIFDNLRAIDQLRTHPQGKPKHCHPSCTIRYGPPQVARGVQRCTLLRGDDLRGSFSPEMPAVGSTHRTTIATAVMSCASSPVILHGPDPPPLRWMTNQAFNDRSMVAPMTFAGWLPL